jgi:hypothetical protein
MSHDKVPLSHVTVCAPDDRIDPLDACEDCDELVAYDHTGKSDPYANVYVDDDALPAPESLPLTLGYSDLDCVASIEGGREVVVSGEIAKVSESNRSGVRCLKFRVEPT